MSSQRGIRADLLNWLGGLFLVFWLFTSTAFAHDLNMTGVKVKLNKHDVSVSVVAHLHLLKTSDPVAELSQRLKLRLDGQPFNPTQSKLIKDQSNGIIIWQSKYPKLASEVALDAPLFPELSTQTTVVTVIKDRKILDEAVLNAEHPSVNFGEKEESGVINVVVRFVREGISHIYTGIDHVLFLLSLLLLGGSWKQLLKIVTAFTLAHSITLSLAATGVLSLAPCFVEPVIALSIVAVAITNFRAPIDEGEKRRDFRPWLAFGFGLVHGFGFAGALTEVGLPRETLAWALLAFNGGVEIGQATLVLVFAPLLAGVVKMWPKLQTPIVRYGSASVAVVGAFWFVQRIFTA